MSLYKILKRMIDTGKTNGIVQKINVFYANDQLTEQEYSELITMAGSAPEREGTGEQA